MGDLLRSFLGRAQVRSKYAENTFVGLCGQSTVSKSSHQWSVGSRCYKRYQSNLTTVADHVFSATSGQILKLRSNEDFVFLSEGECDTLNLALKRIDRLLISTSCIFFSWESIC